MIKYNAVDVHMTALIGYRLARKSLSILTSDVVSVGEDRPALSPMHRYEVWRATLVKKSV